jgi:hypothetical protein
LAEGLQDWLSQSFSAAFRTAGTGVAWSGDRFFDRDGRFGNIHKFFEGDGRTIAPAYGFQDDLQGAIVIRVRWANAV